MIRKLAFVLLFVAALGNVACQNENLQARADSGDASAQFKLGVMYHNGEGIPQDYQQAFHWFTLAANQGFAKAQYNLGVAYHNGEGVPQDDKQAYIWVSIAAANGSVLATENKEAAANQLPPAALQEAQTEAAALSKKIPQLK